MLAVGIQSYIRSKDLHSLKLTVSAIPKGDESSSNYPIFRFKNVSFREGTLW